MKPFSFFFIFIVFAGFSAEAVQEPDACWKNQKFPCAFRSEEPQWLKSSDFSLYFDKKTSVLFQSPTEWQLLGGQIWVETHKPVKMTQWNRDLVISGSVWILREKEMLRLRQFEGAAEVRHKGVLSEVVAQGFENWWTLAGEGVLCPMISQKIFPSWNKFLRFPAPEAKQKIAFYKGLWKEAVRESAGLYQAALQRRVSSIEEQDDQKAAEKVRQVRRQAQLRQLFRDRYYRP